MEQELSSCLLRADVFYLLHGGIGSLGLQIALWMYQVYFSFVLVGTTETDPPKDSTDISQWQALSKKNSVAFRILSYLQEQSDLELRLECCDASFVPDT